MKKSVFLFLLIAPLMVLSQGSLLTSLIESAPLANTSIIETKMSSFISLQKEKMKLAKSEVKFLKSMVDESHRKFLKTYKAYSQFNDPFENGHFDCLSGTAFFSVLLEGLQFDHKIIETNYHIFLLVETNKGQVLIETTDRLFGFKTNSKEIEKCLAQYKENLLAAAPSKGGHYYHYQVDLFRPVNAFQLSGLLYFNQAVIAYNKHEWVVCAERLEKARSIYDNPRVEELTEILAKSISLSGLNEKVKEPLLIHLAKYIKGSTILAIR
jgi:hypothetical protein